MQAEKHYPLYNSTFQLYRLSPLYHGNPPLLAEPTLRLHSRRLRDQLKGDKLRGVQVDFNPEAALSSGVLEDCQWGLLGDELAWIQDHDPDSSQISQPITAETARGIQINLQYEKTTHTAFLLRDPETTKTEPNFTSLPLLLTRMPLPIREVFLNYLATTFDTHIAPLKLPSSFLTSTLETHLHHLTATRSTQSVADIIKKLQLTLSFPTLATPLKNIDIQIAREDIVHFFHQGKHLARTTDTPFTAALTAYLKKHLALDLSNPLIHISTISCGAFALNALGRLKMLEPPFDPHAPDGVSSSELAMQDLYTALVREAGGAAMFLVEEKKGKGKQREKRGLRDAAAAGAASKRARTEGRRTPGAVEGRIPTEPPPPYHLHDPSLVGTQ